LDQSLSMFVGWLEKEDTTKGGEPCPRRSTN
jgi:hypothetical protein